MGQQTRFRKQSSIAVSQLATLGTKSIVQLSKGQIYRELPLRLSGSVTFAAGASNAAATMSRGDEWGLIDRIDVVVNGNDVIRSFTGTQLRMLNRLWYGSVPRMGITLGDGATAAPTFDSTLIIPFWQPLSIKPMDTALDSSLYGDFRLEITWAAGGTFQSAAALTAINVTLDVCSYESFGVTGEFSTMKLYQSISTISAANNAFQVPMSVGPVYRGWFINAASAATSNTADLPNAISNIRIVSGGTVFRDIPFAVLRDWQRQRLGWGREIVQNAAASDVVSNAVSTFMRMSKNTQLVEDAWGFLDLCQDGYLGEGIDTIGFSELNLEFNLSAGCSLTVIPVQIYPVRK